MQKVVFRTIFYLTFLAAFLSACTNSVASNSNQEKEEIAVFARNKNAESDSTHNLKYTTGVRSILEDSQGNFWFGSNQEGVCKFDGEKLTYFTVSDGLSDNQVRSIYEDSSGVVWFECGRGISNYSENKIVTHYFKNYFSTNNWQLNDTDIWFKGDEVIDYNFVEGEPGVYRCDGKNLNYHTFPTYLIKGIEANFSISTSFVRGKKGRLWFGTYGAVIGYDGINFSIIDNEKLGLNEETGVLHVRSIFEDSKGNLWIGNNGIGVLLFDGNTTDNFSKKMGLISENSENRGGYRSPAGSLEHVFSIGEDGEGNIWFGDRDTGAWKFDGDSMTNFTEKDGLTTTHIWQIYNTKSGELWFAMGDGSVCRFNGATFDKIF